MLPARPDLLWFPALFLVSVPAAPGTPAPAQQPAAAIVWNEDAAAHLLDRAALGATRDEVREAARAGLEATLQRLFQPPARVAPPAEPAPFLRGGLIPPDTLVARLDGRREEFLELHSDHILPLGRYGNTWLREMLAGDDPLRDRMTIFWHGHFVSSFREVGDAQKLITQMRFLRENALGKFEVLVRGIARDPAMLQYLNNNKNVQDHPNENWARELMELFSLGDGNYTERDVKEVSRAYTGWTDEERRFVLRRTDHDDGQKTMLGVTGALDGDHVIDVILAQPACARFLSQKLLVFFEGKEPTTERVESYAQALRSSGYEFRAFLERLFRDPAFYRPEIRGQRVAAPVEFLVAAARRLGLRVPGPMLLSVGDLCGQRLFFPPSVKGWDPGLAWITTGSLLQRSNCVAILLGLVDVDSLAVDAEFSDGSMAPAARPIENNQQRTSGVSMLRHVQASGWTPDFSLQRSLAGAGVAPKDEAVAAGLLAQLVLSPVAAPSRDLVRGFLRAEREKGKLAESDLLRPSPEGERLLRRAAHLALSLPEAQLD